MMHKYPLFLILLTLFALPYYMVRFDFFGIPTNVLDIVQIIVIFSGFIYAVHRYNVRDVMQNLRRYKIIIWLVGILMLSACFALISAPDIARGVGLWKSIVLLPITTGAVIGFFIAHRYISLRDIFVGIVGSGLSVASVALWYAIYGHFTYDGRLCAFYQSPNELAMMIVPAMIILGVGALHYFSAQRHSVSYIVRTAVFVGIVLCGYVLWRTQSHAAIGAVVIALVSATMIHFSAHKWHVSWILLGLISALVLIFTVIYTPWAEQYAESSRSSVASRMMIWRSAADIAVDHAIFGIGFGQFQHYYLTYQQFYLPYLEWAVPHPHNLFLATVLYFGIIGCSVFIILLWIIFRHVIHIIFVYPATSRTYWYVLTLYALLLAMMMHGAMDTTIWKNDLAVVFWVVFFSSLVASSKKNLKITK
jgi:O-antigen ligase